MEEIYMEQTNKKSIFKTIIIICFIFGILIGGYVYFHVNNILRVRNIVVELGEKIPTEIDVYVKNKINNINDYKINLLAVSVDDDGKADEVGKFKYTVLYENQKKKGVITVKDTKPPIVEVQELTVGVSEQILLDDFITSCVDYSNTCEVSLKNQNDKKLFSIVGNHSVELKISDVYDNSVIKKVNFTVSKTESLLSNKEKDMKIHHIYPNYDDFDGTITLQFEKALNEDTLDESEEYNDYLELTTNDYSDLVDKTIYEQEILTLYNQYGYIIGFTIKLTFDDNSIMYVK